MGVTNTGSTRLSLVIPALNEELAIGATIQRCLDARDNIVAGGDVTDVEIIVVSDGSTDRTEEIARSFSSVKVVAFDQNRGYGAALKCGFAQASGNLLAFIDADGTCDPELFTQLCRTLCREEADMVLGSRVGPDSHMPWVRLLGNTLFAWMLGLLSRQRVRDTASGMRVFWREALVHLYPLPDGLHFTPAMSARALLEAKLKVLEVPIPYAERVGRSKLSPFSDGLRFLAIIVQAAMCYRPARPLLVMTSVLAMFALFVGWLPVSFYLSNERLEEWMVYRILLASLLMTGSAFLICTAVVSERIAAAAHGRSFAQSGVTAIVSKLFAPRCRWVLAPVLAAIAVAVTWQGIVQYASTGQVDMHWSRAVLASLLLLLAWMLTLTTFVLRMMDLMESQRAGESATFVPDRVHHPGSPWEACSDPAASLFDLHAEDYDAQCMRGLSLTGETRDYFARGRLDFLYDWWQGTGRGEPEVLVDYGCGTGEVTALLSERFPRARVFGLDVSPACIARATESFGCERIVFLNTTEPHAPIPPPS